MDTDASTCAVGLMETNTFCMPIAPFIAAPLLEGGVILTGGGNKIK